MPETESRKLEGLLQQLLLEWEDHIEQQGCLEIPNVPQPDLQNGILPMFSLQRWVRSFGHIMPVIYPRMKPALRLASRLITEDFLLPWFSHVTFGERKLDRSRRPILEYIEASRYERSRGAKAEVQQELQDLGEVLTLMFIPRSANENVYGMTAASVSDMAWYGQYQPGDWPSIDSKYYHGHYASRNRPCVAMCTEFKDFFLRGWDNATTCQRYRTLFVFTATLVHEVAHAYCFWLNYDGKEPLWDKHDRKAELGFSWETVTFGRVLNPLFHDLEGCSVLFSIRTEAYGNPADRIKVMQKLLSRHGMNTSTQRIEPEKCRTTWEIVNPESFRGGRGWFVDTTNWNGMSYMSAIHAVPMKWIINWFQETEWQKKRRIWEQRREYRPPKIGKTFFILYQRNTYGEASVHRPLNMNFEEDVYYEQMRQQLQADGLIDDYWVDKYDEYNPRTGRPHGW